jgi:hypothetical protein
MNYCFIAGAKVACFFYNTNLFAFIFCLFSDFIFTILVI